MFARTRATWHCGAPKGSTFESNIRGTWSLLEAARRTPTVTAVVTASSDKAYGEQPVLPYDEEMPLRPVHPYDVSKACADLLAHSYAATWGLPVTVTRCGNFFGPGDTNWYRLVPATLAGRTEFLRRVSRQVNVGAYRKSRRGPKKPRPPRPGWKACRHVAPYRLLKDRKQRC